LEALPSSRAHPWTEPGDVDEFTGPFFGVWEADGPTSFSFSVRHATYDASVAVDGFEDMWGTATVSPDGTSMEVSRTFAETDASGREEYRHSRTASFVRQRVRRGA
jgi:hypothetical protein